MREVLRTNDPVLINFVVVLLHDGGLEPLVVDQHTSAVEGSIGVLPRRILVASDELAQARRILTEADLSQWISPNAT
jgi:hypothetical protein